MSSPELGRVKKLRRAAYERQGGRCYWCGRAMIYKNGDNAAKVWDHPRVCTADHLVWRAAGGKTTADNIVAACRECNNRRHPPGLKPVRRWGDVTYTKDGNPIVPFCGRP